MKTNFRFLALSAAILSMFTACQREELEQNQKPETPTYKVCFVTDEPDTKTSFEVVDGENGKVAKFSWKSTDSDKFIVYRILEDTFVQASITEGSYDEKTGLMSLNAIFEGTNSPEGAKYQAVFNSSVKSSQSGNQTVYDQNSDVMISNIIDANAFDNQPMLLSFKRLVAIEKMTLKNLTEGVYLKSIAVESVNNKNLVAEYSFGDGDFINYGTSLTINDALSDIESNQAVVYFATVPVDNASLKVTATAVGKDMESFVAAYEKTFAAEKFISFTRGDVKAFSMGMNQKKNEVFDLTSNTTATATTEEISWQSHLVSVIDSKKQSGTDADNYYPGNGNTSTRFYKNSSLAITPKLGISISKIEFEATTEGYANSLASSTWDNADVMAEISGTQYKVLVKPQDGYSLISALIGDTVGLKSIIVWFGVSEPMAEHNIAIDSNIENGAVIADVTQATWGSKVTLKATPAEGYEFGSWTVKTASSEQPVVVKDNQFFMPDEDVVVSATFLKSSDIKKFTIDFTSQGYTNAQVVTKLVADPFTVDFTKGGSNDPKYYTNDNTIRFYSGGTMTVSAEEGINIKKITFTGSVSISDPVVTNKTWSSNKNQNTVTFEADGTNKLSKLEIEYSGQPIGRFNVICEDVEGGKLIASPLSAKENSIVSLTAEPNIGYKFDNNWTVKGIDDSVIEVSENSFTMPSMDVNVSASFSKIAYTINTPSNDRGKISVKIGGSEVTEANYGDEITLSAIPNDGYEFINWSVMDNDNTVVKVTDGKFTMPASPVTVNAYFRSSATYTAFFSVNGSITSKQTCKENDKIDFPENPAEDGYQFVGWAKSDLAGIQTMKPELVNTQTEVMGISNITYYAVFGVIETAVFDASDLSATPAVSGQTSTWKHTASGITLTLSDGQHYTSGSPKTFTVYKGESNYFKISSDNNYTISEIETTISETSYKINKVSSGATLSTSGTTQIVKSDNLTSIQCFAKSSSQIRATKITVKALTGYSTKIITLNEVSISGSPTKTEYTVGDAFDPTGLSVNGTYSDGTTSEITEGISWSYTPSTFTASGNQSVIVTATVKSIVSATYEVNVIVNVITNTLKATNKAIDVNTALDVSTLFTTNSNATISYTLDENPNGAGTLSGSSFTATAAGTYTVKAIQSETTKYSAAEATATITVNTIKLSKPANLRCSEKTETSLTFSWNAVTNASGYQVSLDGTSYEAIKQVTTYTIDDLTAGTTKTLYVKAIGDGTAYTDSDAAYASGTTKTGGSDWSSTYTSNITLSTSGGNRATSAIVKIKNTEYSAMKLGKSGDSGNFTISVPAGTTKLYLFAAGWNSKTNTITLSGANVSPSTAQTLTADSGVSGQSTTYTIAGTPSTYFFEFSFGSSSSAQNIKISCSERCVVWGVNAE